MKILIDIGHPAHVHLFKNFAHLMQSKGHLIHFSVRDKEFEIALLENEGFTYTNLGKHYKEKPGKIWGLLRFNLAIFNLSRKFKPDIFLSHGSVYTALASLFLRIPNIALEDTGNAEQVNLYLPFTRVVLTSTSFHKSYGKKHIRYNGYHELAYLHPKYFSPDNEILNKLGLLANERFVIIRLVSWNASHDKDQTGLTIKVLKSLIQTLSSSHKIFISSESNLPDCLEGYKFELPPQDMHNALAFADLFIGEGATMASECAMLGIPVLYVNSIEADTIDEQEKRGLLFHLRNSNEVLNRAVDLTSGFNSKEEFIKRRNKMLKEKIDVTALLVWFIENYPDSFKILKENPGYQEKFRI